MRVPPDEMAGSQPSEGRRGRRRPSPSPLGVEVTAETEEETSPAPTVLQPASDPWTGLFQSGLALLQQLATPGGGKPAPSNNGPVPRSLVQRDERTGETFLKLPVPPPEVLNQALQAFGALLQSLRK